MNDKLKELIAELRYVAQWAEHHLDKAKMVNDGADAILALIAERDEHKENAMRNARSALTFKAGLDKWKRSYDLLKVEYDDLYDQNEKVLADRDALALDAARYRWLFADMATSGDLDRAERALACFENSVTGSKDELDAAIDSAMKGTP